MTIVRMWTGVVRTDDRDAYAEYVERTGMDAYRATPGNLGAELLTRDLGDGRTEITTVSRWRSLADVAAFAGDDIERAVFYPEDDRYLVERDPRVRHYERSTDAGFSGDESPEPPEFAAPPGDPLLLARAWLAAAEAVREPLSMTLATSSPAGPVAARSVNVTEIDDRGLVFGTSTRSAKYAHLAANPHAALQAYWRETMQQLRFEGRIETLSDAESDALFSARSSASRAATAVAEQSAPFPDGESPETLVDRARELGDDVARPSTWVGMRLVPDRVEFWLGRRDRMHRRLQYVRAGQGWEASRLQP